MSDERTLVLTAGALQFRAWREEQGLTVAQVGSKLVVDTSQVRHLEQGRRTPSLDLAVKIEAMTSIPPRDWKEEVE